MQVTHSDFQIRPATLADVPRLLDLHYRAFDTKSNLLMLLGRRFMVKALRWYTQNKEAFALLAEQKHTLAGYVSVNRGSYYYMLQSNWPHAFLALLLRPHLLCNQPVVDRLRDLIKPRPLGLVANAERASLAYIAVDPASRVKGVGSALLHAALSRARLLGWSEVLASFHSSNSRARNLFIRAGFEYAPQQDLKNLVCVCWHSSTQAPFNPPTHSLTDSLTSPQSPHRHRAPSRH